MWKFAGLAPIIRWGEFDFESVFASGRDTFGDQGKIEEQVAVAAGVSAEIGASPAEAQAPAEEAAQATADVHPSEEHERVTQVVKEDGKHFDMEVKVLPVENVEVTA